MSYLLDKKTKRKKILSGSLLVFIVLILFYFRSPIWNSFSYASHLVFRPFLVVGGDIGGKLSSVKFYFLSKRSLFGENQNLKLELSQVRAQLSNYDSVLSENTSLKEILGRTNGASRTLSAILGKASQSPYDTLIIDIGADRGLLTGDIVFALGDVPVGRVSDVYPTSSKVTLFSKAGVKTEAAVGDKNIFLEVVGRGGGNFEITLPRDFTLVKGDRVVLPGITPFTLATVETIISDPRDPYIKALLTSPVNIQELKFVHVESQK